MIVLIQELKYVFHAMINIAQLLILIVLIHTTLIPKSARENNIALTVVTVDLH
jgi:hypothetical protein